ncbi:unnamed protein product [Effrenium voratum]|uniref:X8 domain-containing protein n=1 Tax=Effrenium voratum TaxID=2562239 RepID=A0AA36IJ57_9DINO|nr:unnamed protein product [Effrenium voratum]
MPRMTLLGQAMPKCIALFALLVGIAASLDETQAFIDCAVDSDSCAEMEDNTLQLIQMKRRLLPAKAEKTLMKGVSYGPSPFTSPAKNKHYDYFCDSAEAMWGDSGRADLRVIKSLGANTVRLYGNDPQLSHEKFLDHAWSLGLHVIPGMGDKAFATPPCKGSGDFSCAEGVKKAYAQNLEKGFLQANRSYHPAIKYFIVVNEPELKLPSLSEPKKFARAVVSAIDGVLEAEEEAQVQGPKPNLTVTFSFASCAMCEQFQTKPGLGQLWTLFDALRNPVKYGVTTQRNLTDFFRTRFTYSFNSGNPAEEIEDMFLAQYQQLFPTTPIFVAEYHDPYNKDTQADLQKILEIAQSSPLLLGVSFFEFQNRYDQAGHLVWGMFDPQQDNSSKLRVEFQEYSSSVPCLSPVFDGSRTIAEQLTTAYGGPGIEPKRLCMPNPQQVVVSKHGFRQMVGLQNITSMQQFIERVVEKLGGFVPFVVPKEFAELFLRPGSNSNYHDLEELLTAHPQWARWDTFSACTVDAHALESSLGGKIGYVCGLGYADCSQMPPSCKGSVWNAASWTFGMHFKELVYARDSPPKPLQQCYLDGSAQFVRSSIWKKSPLKPECVVPLGWSDPNKVFITQHGFHLIWSDQDPTAMRIFIRRTVEHTGGEMQNGQVPEDFIQKMLGLEGSFRQLQAALHTRPSWAYWGPSSACVPDKAAKAREVGGAIGVVCSKGIFDCKTIPEKCKGSVWDNAAYVFGSYYKALRERGQRADPLWDCEFTGRAVFASPKLIDSFNLTQDCVVQVSTRNNQSK